ASAPTSSVTEDASSATVSITAPQGKYTLKFAKTGALAGHLTSMDASGNVTCDEDLGAQAEGPDGGAPGGDGGTGPNGGGGGCNCNQSGDARGNAFTILSFAALFAFSRRRRRPV